MQGESQRPHFSSAWGTVLTTAGVAIGLGNIWRFPYMMGQNGGAAFLVVYLVVVVMLGIPALMAEWALGRATQRGTLGAFARCGMRGGSWWSALLLFSVGMASSYYGVVLAWVLYFTIKYAACALWVTETPSFHRLSSSFFLQMAFVVVTVGSACALLLLGVRRGIERASRVALPLFFAMFVVLAVRVLTLDGAGEGIRELFVPRWELVTSRTCLTAMGQAFFSLGLGGTFMVVYGSYMRPDENIPRGAVLTAGADLCAAILAAVIIVPAACAFGVPRTTGVSLLFEAMPNVFAQMPGGFVWGAIFFGSILLVGLLSLVAAFEVVGSAVVEALGWKRSKTLVLLALAEILLAIPALMIDSYIPISDLIWGTTMQPIGAAVALVALGWCLGRSKALAEIRAHSDWPVPGWLHLWIKYVIPISIVAMLLYGWLGQ